MSNALFSKKAIQYERAVLDALDVNAQVFFGAESIGDGFVRHLAAVKTLQLDLLRMYLAAVKKIDASDEDKDALKRFIMRMMENFNQCLSMALAGSFRLALDTEQEKLYNSQRNVPFLQEHLDKLMLQIAKFKMNITDDPKALTKLTPVLREANVVLSHYPETLGYLNCIRSVTSARYSDGAQYSPDTEAYLSSRDTGDSIINALKGMYSEKGLDELIDRVENDVNWYTEAQKFMPSDGEINEVIKDE